MTTRVFSANYSRQHPSIERQCGVGRERGREEPRDGGRMMRKRRRRNVTACCGDERWDTHGAIAILIVLLLCRLHHGL